MGSAGWDRTEIKRIVLRRALLHSTLHSFCDHREDYTWSYSVFVFLNTEYISENVQKISVCGGGGILEVCVSKRYAPILCMQIAGLCMHIKYLGAHVASCAANWPFECTNK